MDELSKVGDINSVGDFFDFKLSIKSIIIIGIIWSILAGLFIIFIFGGVNNTIEYVNNILKSTKKSIVIL